MKQNRVLLLTLLTLTVLALSVAQAYAAPPPNKGKDPSVTAKRVGSTGGGDGTVTFKIDNHDGTLPIVNLNVTIITDDEIRDVTATPTGWSSSGIVFKNGKAVNVAWSTTTDPVPAGGSLNGFSVKMAGQTPYTYTWILTNTVSGTWTGSVTV